LRSRLLVGNLKLNADRRFLVERVLYAIDNAAARV
jgi:hypothetical protein